MAPFGFRGYNGEVRTAAALAVALGAVIVTTAAAAPKPHVERARAGAVEAVFSYSYDAAAFRFTRQRLTITRDGVTSFSAALRKPPGGGFNAQPARYFLHKRSVFVTDVDGDGEPEVVLDLYWAGAHCCWYSQIYRYVPATGHYSPLVHVWGNFGYVFADLDHDGTQELVTRDDRFSYAFASFADSRWPVRILRLRAVGLTVETPPTPVSRPRCQRALARGDEPEAEGEQPGNRGRLGRGRVHGRPLRGRVQDDRPPLPQRQDPRRAHPGRVRAEAAQLPAADRVLA